MELLKLYTKSERCILLVMGYSHVFSSLRLFTKCSIIAQHSGKVYSTKQCIGIVTTPHIKEIFFLISTSKFRHANNFFFDVRINFEYNDFRLYNYIYEIYIPWLQGIYQQYKT